MIQERFTSYKYSGESRRAMETSLEGIDYFSALPETGWVLHESSPLSNGDVRWTERHLQCIWHDERLRPGLPATAAGERIEVVHPGRWNSEAGPDFLDAVLRVGPDNRRIRGDVELHIRSSDWSAHGHYRDPRYANVVLHATFFPGHAEHLPPHALEVSLMEALRSVPGFSFEDIDLGAYPHAIIQREACPCSKALDADPERIESLLRCAGRHRIGAKTLRMASLLKSGDRYQVFYEETFASLGFKHNAGALRRLAQTLPVRELTSEPDMETRYARLLGIAGLLPDTDASATPDAAVFARRLWDRFWISPKPEASPPLAWRLSGVRPSNRPQRRIAAAVALFPTPAWLLDRIEAIPRDNPRIWFRGAAGALSISPVPWYAMPGGMLVGKSRIAAILANTVVPLLLAEGRIPEGWIEHLPGEQTSAPMREMAWRLLGRDHHAILYARRGLLQQGLLQLHYDFCLGTRLGCSDCPLPRRIETEVFRERVTPQGDVPVE